MALGDAIVRDLVRQDLVRLGIRHHHERWDGDGYLDGLGGEEIPLVARVLAVGDAFSAMTTTRPYRKALSVEEALRRLTDAASSQLDEQLVVAFVQRDGGGLGCAAAGLRRWSDAVAAGCPRRLKPGRCARAAIPRRAGA